ncbi:MAG: SIMPL domain-containing protein [Methanosarcinales archaeon]|nr:SIMPL domain-containing protein [Methanosarcinales archaeon]
MNDKIMKKIYASLLGLAILVIVAGTASAYFVYPSSTGTVTVSPDKAVVYLGVQTQSADATTAQQENAEKMDRIIAALKDAGIAEDDMETSGYSMYPMRSYEAEEPTITGYVVSNRLMVTVTDVDKVGDIIDTAVNAGANEVQSVSFTLSDDARQDARSQALENAVEAARSDADTLAEILDVTLLGPVEVTTSGGSVVTPYPVPYAAVDEAGYEMRKSTSILPGDISVTAYVQMVYQFA